MADLINTSELYPKIDPEILDSCIHCGLCLPACPTYLTDYNENHSPRGRIHLIKAWSQKRIEYSDSLSQSINTCLMCLGCQTACPSGVNYEAIIESAKVSLINYQNPFLRKLTGFVFKYILPNYLVLKFSYYLLKLWQFINGKKIFGLILYFLDKFKLENSKFYGFFNKLNELQLFLPDLNNYEPFNLEIHDCNPCTKPSAKMSDNVLICSRPQKLDKQYVFFTGCVMEVFYHNVNQSVVNVLAKNNIGVASNKQTCCGALALHNGQIDIARKLAAKNIAYLGSNQLGVIVTGSGCTAMLKHYENLFTPDDGEIYSKARAFSRNIQDSAQVLAKFDNLKLNLTNKIRVGYHAACHLAHAQNIHDEPVEFFKKLENNNKAYLQFIPIEEAEYCCGSAGIYNLMNTQTSLLVLERKMKFIKEAGLNYIVTSNPGCLLQLQTGCELFKVDVKVMHIYELLDTLIN